MNDNKLETVANISQLISLYLLLQDASNADIMRELAAIRADLNQIKEKLNEPRLHITRDEKTSAR